MMIFTFYVEKYATENLVTLGSIGEMPVTLASLWNGGQVANIGNANDTLEAKAVIAIAVTVLYLKGRSEQFLESHEPDWEVTQKVALTNCKKEDILIPTNPAAIDNQPVVNNVALALVCCLFYFNIQAELKTQKAQVSRVCLDMANHQYKKRLSHSEKIMQNVVDYCEQEQMDLPCIR